MGRSRALGVVAAFIWALVSPPSGAPATQGNSQLPKIRTETELVLVPLIAHRGGKHVESLKRDDFTVYLDGKPQTIAVFEEIRPAMPVKPAPTEEFTNLAGDARQAAQQITIIALDLNNTAPFDQAYLKQEIVKFLNAAAKTQEPFALVAVTRSGIRVLHDFTTDSRLLADAVRSRPLQIASKEAPGGTVLDFTPCALSAAGCGGGKNAEEGAKQLESWITMMTNQERFEMYRDRSTRIDTLAALQQLAQSLRGLPGRKTLVWASSGFQIVGGMNRMFTGRKDLRGGASTNLDNVGTALDQNDYTFNLLNQANIAVYPLDARHGANTSFIDYDIKLSDAPLPAAVEVNRNMNNEIIDGFKAIAAATGGKPCFNRTDLSNCLQEAVNDSHNYYMLGFYLDKKPKTGWLPISVTLNGPRTELTYRDGILLSEDNPEKNKLTDLQLALLSPLNYTALPFRGRFDKPVDKDGKKLTGFALDVPPGALNLGEGGDRLALDVVVVVRGKGGKEVARIAQRIDRTLTAEQAAVIRAQGVHYTNKLELPTGEYAVWFVVREGLSGQTGSTVTTVAIK